MTRLVLSNSDSIYGQVWNDEEICKYFSKGKLLNLQYLHIPELVLNDNCLFYLTNSVMELKGLEISNLSNISTLYQNFFNRLEMLKVLNLIHSVDLRIEWLENLKFLSITSVHKLDLELKSPNLETLELEQVNLSTTTSTLPSTLKHLTLIHSLSLAEIIVKICASSMKLETFNFTKSWHFLLESTPESDISVKMIAFHPNFSQLKQLTLQCKVSEQGIEHLTSSNLKLDSMTLGYLSYPSLCYLCDGSIRYKIIQIDIGDQHEILGRARWGNFFVGSLRELTQSLINSRVHCREEQHM